MNNCYFFVNISLQKEDSQIGENVQFSESCEIDSSTSAKNFTVHLDYYFLLTVTLMIFTVTLNITS